MVYTDKKTYLDIHTSSYIYVVKIIVSDFTSEGNLKVYEMTEKKKLCDRDSLLPNKSGRVFSSSYAVA